MFVLQPFPFSLSALSTSFTFGFPLDSGNRAQLSSDAGQRRPSQKEKYVSSQDHLSPSLHPTLDILPSIKLLDWMSVFLACMVASPKLLRHH